MAVAAAVAVAVAVAVVVVVDLLPCTCLHIVTIFLIIIITIAVVVIAIHFFFLARAYTFFTPPPPICLVALCPQFYSHFCPNPRPFPVMKPVVVLLRSPLFCGQFGCVWVLDSRFTNCPFRSPQNPKTTKCQRENIQFQGKNDEKNGKNTKRSLGDKRAVS